MFHALRLDNGAKPTPAQVQAMADAFQKAAKTSLPISVVKNPSEIDGIPVNVAPGRVPTGGVIGGRIYLFTADLRSRGEVLVTIFHELFHYGLQNVVPAEQYVALIRCVASNSMVPRYMTLWNAPTASSNVWARVDDLGAAGHASSGTAKKSAVTTWLPEKSHYDRIGTTVG